MVAQLDTAYVTTRPARALSRAVSYAFFEGRPLLTRGRWINPWLLRRAKKVAQRKQSAAVDRPLFILGTGRSGTTVLGKILSMHREVGWLNEPKLMWHAACEHEDLNGNYTDSAAAYRLAAADATPAVQRAMRNQYAAYLRTTRNSRVLDKYPELIFRTEFVRQIFPDARFLFLVRDGYATCRSIARWSQHHGQSSRKDNTDWWGVNRRKWQLLVEQLVRRDPQLGNHADTIAGFDDHVSMAAVEWILTMQEGLRLTETCSDVTLTVHYEQLTRAPRETVADILQFAGLQPDETVLDYARKTLRPVGETAALELPAIIRNSFDAAMQKLGYQSAPNS